MSNTDSKSVSIEIMLARKSVLSPMPGLAINIVSNQFRVTAAQSVSIDDR